MIGPGESVFEYGFTSGFVVFFNSYGDDLESSGVILGIEFYQIGVVSPTGWAPGTPKIQKYIVTLQI